MKLRVWAVTFVIAMVSQGAQAAGQGALFQDFMRNCASHPGDPVAALNDVSQQGWMEVPQKELMAKAPPVAVPGVKLQWYRMYLSAQPGRSLALLAGRGEMLLTPGRPAVPVGVCMAVQKPLDTASIQDAGSWASVKPALDSPEATMYLFAETTSGKRAVTPTQIGDSQADNWRELLTLNHPGEQTSSIAMIAPIAGATK